MSRYVEIGLINEPAQPVRAEVYVSGDLAKAIDYMSTVQRPNLRASYLMRRFKLKTKEAALVRLLWRFSEC